MKKLTIFLCVLLLIIPIVIALEFDNVKEYDENLKTYTITNTFGIGSDIATLKLETPQNNIVDIGYQKVAEITIDNKEDYNEIIKGIELYQIDEGMKPFKRQIDYKYYNGKDWVDFNSNLKEGEVITLGLFTNVNIRDHVEWILNMYGERLTEWAEWTSSLNVDIIAAYNFDENTGTTSTNSVDGTVYNLTVTGSHWNATGINGSCYSPAANESVNTTINIGQDLSATSPDFSLNVWINRTGTTGNDYLIAYGPQSGNGQWSLAFSHAADEELTLNFKDNSVDKFYREVFTLNDWFMYTITFNSTHLVYYENGIIVNYSRLHSWTFPATEDIILFSDASAGNKAEDTLVDSIYIWNRTLLPSEVVNLYNSGVGIFYIPEAGGGEVTLNFPTSSMITPNNSLSFNSTAVYTDGDLVNSTLHLWFEGNDSLLGTNTTTTFDSNNNSIISYTGIPFNNKYLWNVKTCMENATDISCTFADENRTLFSNLSAFGPCGGTLKTEFLNITFRNETLAEEWINATVDIDFTIWGDTPSRNSTLSYTNSTENPMYRFCYGANQTINTLMEINPYDNAISQARTVEELLSLSKTITHKTYYLLPTSVGQFVTFQVINNAEQVISGVNATVKKDGDIIEQEFTDDAGSVQFFLNPDTSYVFTFSKEGYSTYTTTLTPSQTSYTINLGGASTTTAPSDYGKRIDYSIRPTINQLDNSTTYSFNFTISSEYWTVDEFGFVLTNGSTVLGSTSAATNGGTVNINLDTSLNRTIVMNAYWVINSSYQNVTKTWVVIATGDTSFSILHFFTDLTSYINSGLFGMDNFGLALFLFLFIFLFTGIMAYRFGLTSPETILVLIFSLVLFLDVGVGMMDNLNPANAVPHFPTIFMGVIMIALFLREVSR